VAKKKKAKRGEKVSLVQLFSPPCMKTYKFISIRSKEIGGRFYEILFRTARHKGKQLVEVYFANEKELILEPITFVMSIEEFAQFDYSYSIGSMFREIMSAVLSEYEEYEEMICDFDFDAPKVFVSVFENMNDYEDVVDYMKYEKDEEYSHEFWETHLCSKLEGRNCIDF
jgi:hypothetical protein